MSGAPITDICRDDNIRVIQTELCIGDKVFIIIESSVTGPTDDRVYTKCKDVWYHVPRGKADIIFKGMTRMFVGLRKFGYMKDSYGNPDAVTYAVITEKANGECARVGALLIDSVRYWVVGSKHVHIVFAEGRLADAESAYTDKRYMNALCVARIWDSMLSTGTYNTEAFHAFLWETGFSACAEALRPDVEHFVTYEEKNILMFFALANPELTPMNLTAVSPMEASRIFTEFGLPVVSGLTTVYAYNSEEYKAQIARIESATNSEGAVVYGMDDDHNVVCMWKEKAVEYIAERIVREAATHKMKHLIREYILKRISDFSGLERWKSERFPFLLNFIGWLYNTNQLPVSNPWSISSKWLTLQMEFSALPTHDFSHILDGIHEKTIILLEGLPCCGKSTVCRSLQHILRKLGFPTSWINQDECDSRRDRYVKVIENVFANPDIKYILLDKTNLDPANLSDYAKLGIVPTFTLWYNHPDGVDAMKEVCATRFESRGNGHLSLCPSEDMTREKFLGICDKMYRKFTPPRACESVMELDVTHPITHVLEQVLDLIGFSDHVSLIDEAIAYSKAYETAIVDKKKPIYSCVQLESDSFHGLLSLIPLDVLEGKFARKSGHVTHKYFKSVDPAGFLAVESLVGQKFTLQVDALVYNDKCVAASVVSPEGWNNKHPHVTLALSRGTEPVYSNELLQTETSIRLPITYTIKGTYMLA
jgi:hypothetical protein